MPRHEAAKESDRVLLEVSDGIAPVELLHSLLRRWPILVVAGVIGGMAGYIFSLLRPPIFQAEAVLAVNMDYGITQPLELVVEDRALSRVAALIRSDATLETLLDRLPRSYRAAREWQVPTDLRAALHLDQRLAEWGLIVSDHDPVMAAEVAHIWAETAIAALDEAATHGWEAMQMVQGRLDVRCLLSHQSRQVAAQELWQCIAIPDDSYDDDLIERLQGELSLSQGIVPMLSYDYVRRPLTPEDPVIWPRIPLVLAGSFAGLIIGLIRVVLPDPKFGIRVRM